MKILTIWTLLIAVLLPLTACHWNHRRHHYRFANEYSIPEHARNYGDQFEAKAGSRAA
jgi:hypothetical protein